MDQKVAIVTGGNRGIGLEIGRQLGGHGLRVLLAARDRARGQVAVAALRHEGLEVDFHRLDVTDQTSVRRLVKDVADRMGRVDVLVNNAAIYVDRGLSAVEVDLALVRQTMETNFYGPLRLCRLFVPLMQRHGYGRIVNVSSRMGSLHHMGGGALAYRTSKTALNALTRVLAADLAGTNILVNSVDPGWVRTEMGRAHAARSVEEGADTAVWLATLPDDGPTGGFFRDRQPAHW